MNCALLCVLDMLLDLVLSTHPMLTLPGSATLSHALPPKAGTLSSCSDHSRLSDLIGSLIFL